MFACSVVKGDIIYKQNTEQDSLYEKEKIRIVVTDSGTGGLSVLNSIADKLEDLRAYKEAELIFVNALFDAKSGYNALQTRDKKIEVFNNVLNGINQKYHPDLIFVACNTLSVFINDTRFVRQKNNPPVIGIVDAGVKMIAESLDKDSNSKVIILGTETTITENNHKKALLDMHYEEERIITQACPQLQSYIEQDPGGEETEMLISFYLSEALSYIDDTSLPVYLSLNCSHFGYSEDLWRKAMADLGYNLRDMLNPNMLMADVLINDKNKNRYSHTDISFLVVSKVELVNVNSMIEIFKNESPSLAKALLNYRIIPDIF